jgi:hypothetical protein
MKDCGNMEAKWESYLFPNPNPKTGGGAVELAFYDVFLQQKPDPQKSFHDLESERLVHFIPPRVPHQNSAKLPRLEHAIKFSRHFSYYRFPFARL